MVSGSIAALGNIWLNLLLMRSSDGLSPLLMGVLKRGVAAEVPWVAQFQDGSESLTGGGVAEELGPRVCICGKTEAEAEVADMGAGDE